MNKKRVNDAVTRDAQHARFAETACALGCGEDEAAFKATLAVIARPKPKGEPGPPKGGLGSYHDD